MLFYLWAQPTLRHVVNMSVSEPLDGKLSDINQMVFL